MLFNYKSLLLTAVLPLALTGCGGSGSNPGPQPDPQPVPQAPKIINVTTASQDVQNLQMTSPVMSAAAKASRLNSKAPRDLLKDGINVNPVVTLTVEYSGDSAPALPGSDDGIFTFDGFDYAMPCANPVNQGDLCMHANLYFSPNTTSYNNSVSLLNGMVKAHGYVPFRMFPLNNSMVTGTPTKPGFHMLMTTVYQGVAQFNPQGMPTTATFTTDEILQDPTSSSKKALPITFTVKADAKNKSLIDVDYTPTKDLSAFMQAPYLKTYGADDHTQLAYTASAPSGAPTETTTTVPVQATLTRAFVISTDQGEAYALNNPTDVAASEIGTITNGNFSSLSSFTKGQSLKDITLPIRNNEGLDFLSPISLNKSGEDDIYGFGALTGDNYDIQMTNPKVDNNGEGFVARSRYQSNGDNDYVATLVNNTDKTDNNAYHLIVADNEMPSQGKSVSAKVYSIKGLPKLSGMQMTLDYADFTSSVDMAMLFSGYNTQTQKQQLYLVYTYNKTPQTTLDAILIDDSSVSPIKFSYNTYDSSQLGRDKEMASNEELVYFNSDKTQMTLMSYDAAKQVFNKTTVSTKNIEGTPRTFSCSDTDTGAKSVNNTCYLLTESLNAKTHAVSHRVYYFNNLDVDAGQATTTSDFGTLAFTDSIMKPLTKAVIDGNTGALLALGVDNKMSLYVLNDKQYQKSQAVTLPNTKAGKAQLPTHIYEY